jgi:vancomycin permeability regulator SanA
VAPVLIMTGGPAHNQFVEGEAMKVLAVSEGVPAEDVIVERKAQDTIQNIYYSDQILEAHHWHAVEVVSSPSHLPRAALILAHWKDLTWSTHAARWPPGYTPTRIDGIVAREATMCWMLTHGGLRHSEYLPGS